MRTDRLTLARFRTTAFPAVGIAICLLCVGCATSSERGGAPGEADAATYEAPTLNRLTIELRDTTMGEVVREIGNRTGGSLVLLNGLEERPLESVNYVNAELPEVAADLAEQAECAIQVTDGYRFIFAPGYETLTQTSLSNQTDPRFRERIDKLAVGANIPLHAVLAWIGQAYDTTVVADNAVAAARTGEVALQTVYVDQAVEALLKSARVNAVAFDSTDEYLFLYTPENLNPRSAMLNDGELPQALRQRLDRRVTVALPEPSSDPGRLVVGEARRLRDVLTALSMQLGIRVVAEPELMDIPINPAHLSNVRVQTALDLLIRQWLLPNYGYQVTHDRIVLRRRTASEQVAP